MFGVDSYTFLSFFHCFILRTCLYNSLPGLHMFVFEFAFMEFIFERVFLVPCEGFPNFNVCCNSLQIRGWRLMRDDFASV